MENNLLSVAILLSVNIKNTITIVEGKCREIAYFSSVMLRQKNAALYQSILR